MANKVNGHVKRLQRYLPFSPSHDQIYEEYQDTENALDLDTCALKYLEFAVENGACLVLLTGDAGHGKTHLCRRLLEKYSGYSKIKARSLLNSSCDGSTLIYGQDDSTLTPLRIYKDFSEMSIEVTSDHIENAMEAKNEVTIICANEGRLRAVLEAGRDKKHSKNLLDRFNASFKDGLASNDGIVHIINLNYQSVASNSQQSLLKMALKSWVLGTRWKTCEDCDSCLHCPILLNRRLLSDIQNSKAQTCQSRIELLFATVERLGTVVTIREILMTIAFIITGGLSCEDVHKRLSNRKKGWQNKFVYYNTIFDPPAFIGRDKLSKIPVLNQFTEIDPGKRSIRAIDEILINEQDIFESGSLDLNFIYKNTSIDVSCGIDEVIGVSQSKKERSEEARYVQEIVRSLRRKLFFEGEDAYKSIMSPLGFEYGDEFLEVLAGNMQPKKMMTLKNKLISGLHTIQGLQMTSKETTLHVVDPSFANTSSHAAIISRRIPTTSIKILPMQEAWIIDSSFTKYGINKSVDWLDRYIVLRIDNDSGGKLEFPINLMVFDCIARAESGYVAREFYAHDLRRIKTFLGSLVREQSSEDGDISLFIHGKMHSVSIDDGVIQVGGGH